MDKVEDYQLSQLHFMLQKPELRLLGSSLLEQLASLALHFLTLLFRLYFQFLLNFLPSFKLKKKRKEKEKAVIFSRPRFKAVTAELQIHKLVFETSAIRKSLQERQKEA